MQINRLIFFVLVSCFLVTVFYVLLLPVVTFGSSAQSTLVIVNKAVSAVSPVDLLTAQTVSQIQTVRMPHKLALSPDSRYAYVTK